MKNYTVLSRHQTHCSKIFIQSNIDQGFKMNESIWFQSTSFGAHQHDWIFAKLIVEQCLFKIIPAKLSIVWLKVYNRHINDCIMN